MFLSTLPKATWLLVAFCSGYMVRDIATPWQWILVPMTLVVRYLFMEVLVKRWLRRDIEWLNDTMDKFENSFYNRLWQHLKQRHAGHMLNCPICK